MCKNDAIVDNYNQYFKEPPPKRTSAAYNWEEVCYSLQRN